MNAEERTEATRRRILAAACEVIAEMGFEGVRMRIVAARAEVSSALLHYHFSNRETLFLAALRHSFEHTGEETYLAEPPAEAPATFRLARIVDACLPLDTELRRDFVLWQELLLRGTRDAESKDLAVLFYQEMREWIGGTIRDGINRGEFIACDVPAVTDLLLALTDGFGIRLMLDDPVVTADRTRQAVWACLSRELGITRPFPPGGPVVGPVARTAAPA